jgi:hypothetical protein
MDGVIGENLQCTKTSVMMDGSGVFCHTHYGRAIPASIVLTPQNYSFKRCKDQKEALDRYINDELAKHVQAEEEMEKVCCFIVYL